MEEKQGKLASIGLPRLLHLIYRKGDDASVLDIVREPVHKRFFFKDGVPVAATSNILNEVLGRLLMREGIISQQEYESSLQKVLKEKKKHGEVLIGMGLITAEQLDTFLALQLKRRLWRMFGWSEGTYRYSRAESAPASVSKKALLPAGLILDGINLGFYPSERLNSDLKACMDKPLMPVEEPEKYKIDDFGLNLQEKRFVAGFDGTRSIRDALEGSDLLRHRALSISLSLIITGFLKDESKTDDELDFFEPAPEAASNEGAADQRLNAELLFMRARANIESGEYKKAISTLREITELNPMEGEYWAYLGWAVYKDNPESVDEANRLVRDAIDLNNDLDAAWYFLGMLSLASDDVKMAQRAFKSAVARNPWMLEAVSELKRIEINASLSSADIDRAEYMESMGLAEDPFTPCLEPRFLVPVEGQTQAIDFLVKAVRKKTAPVLITGARGTGKTTVMLELLNRLSNEKVLAAALTMPPDKELDLMKEINMQVESPTEASSIKEQLLNLGMRVSQNKINGGHTIIIIDSAHRLTAGCIKLIQYLSRLKTLQIILLAEPELATRLKDPDFRELDTRLSQRFDIAPMSGKETVAYMRKRLKEARKDELAGELFGSLETRALESVYEQSKGVAGEVNRAGALMLAKLALEGAPHRDVAPTEEQSFESMRAPHIFPENEMDINAARRELEIEPAPEAPALEQARQKNPPEIDYAFGKEPETREKPGRMGTTLAKAVLWVLIVIAAAAIAGVLSGMLDIESLLNRLIG